MKIYNLVSDERSKNKWPQWDLHLNLQNSHVTLVSRYLVLAAVNWPWNGSPISNGKDVSCMQKMSRIDLYIFFGCCLALLCCLINILRGYIWACDMVMWHWSTGFLFWQLSIDMTIQLFSWCEPLCDQAWISPTRELYRQPCWPWKMNSWFHNIYAWFSSVCPIPIGIGLQSLALQAGEAPL